MTSEAQNTPVSTPSGPSAGLEGQDATQETQDATEAAQRRVEQAGTLGGCMWCDADACNHGAHLADATIGSTESEVSLYRALHESVRAQADAALVAERDRLAATIAELRAEVERLRAFNVQIAESNAARLHAALEREEAAKVNGFRMAERLSKVESALFAAWDAGNAVGLDGYIGPNRGEEPDREAILARSGCVAKQLAILDAPKDTTAP